MPTMIELAPPPKRQCRRPDTPLPFMDDPELDHIYENTVGLLAAFVKYNDASQVIQRAWRSKTFQPTMPTIEE